MTGYRKSATKAKPAGKKSKPANNDKKEKVELTEPLERDEQKIVVTYCRKKQIPIAAVPNDAKRTMWAAIQAKATGLAAGFPDLIIPVMRAQYGCLFIEMKRKTMGALTENQQYWLNLLNVNGYYAVCCHGADAAIHAIEKYLLLPEPMYVGEQVL